MQTQLLPPRCDQCLHSSRRDAELQSKLLPRQVAQSDSDMDTFAHSPLRKRAKAAARAFIACQAGLTALAEQVQQAADRADEEDLPSVSPPAEAAPSSVAPLPPLQAIAGPPS